MEQKLLFRAKPKYLTYLKWGIIVLALLIALSMRFSVAVSKIELGGDSLLRYDPIARNLAAGNGFSKEKAAPYIPDDFDMPAYPYFIAAIYKFTGNSTQAVVFIQIFCELLISLFVFLIARQLSFSRSAAWLAVFFSLAFPLLSYFSGFILTEILTTLFSTIMIYCAVSALKKEQTKYYLFFGLSAGICVLIRADTIVAVTLVFAAVIIAFVLNQDFSNKKLKIFAARIMVSGFVFLFILSIWTIRNYHEFGVIRPFGRVTEQSRLDYVKWLNTWLDDVKYIDVFWWDVYFGNFSNPASFDFPSDKVLLGANRANAALLTAKENGTLEGTAAIQFAALTNETQSQYPLQVYLIVPFKRLFKSINNLPSYIENRSFSILTKLFWYGLILCSLFGVIFMFCRRHWMLLPLIAICLGRFFLPFWSALAVEPRYLVLILPAVFVLAAYFFDQVFESKIYESFSNRGKWNARPRYS